MDWLQWITASGAMGAFGLALATWFKTRPAMKLAQSQADGPLWTEIAALRQELRREREQCDKRIEALESKVTDLEHDLASETTNFDSFLLIAEASPDSIMAMIPRIREDRRHHKERMALKKGAREGAKNIEPGGD